MGNVMDRPKISQVVIDEFTKIIDAQDSKGIMKYGKTIDGAIDTDYKWEIMALEEAADLQKYLVRRIRQLEGQVENQLNMIRDLKKKDRVKNFLQIAQENLDIHEQLKVIKQENERLKVIEQAYEAYKKAQ